MNGRLTSILRLWPTALAVLALLGAWQLAASTGAIADALGLDSFLVPSPAEIGDSLWTDRSLLADNAWVTLQEVVAGFAAALALDLGLQAVHVANQSLIYRVRSEARSRIAAGYMIFYSVGSALGAIASTVAYARAGWYAVCLLGAAFSAVAVCLWAATRRAPGMAECRPDERLAPQSGEGS